MALHKEIVQNDGVTTVYHRINAMLIHVHHLVTVEVISYLSNDARNAQKEDSMEPYEHVSSYRIPYDELGSPTITDAYIWLKNQPEFEGSEDVFEDDNIIEVGGSEFMSMLEEVL